MKEIDGQTIFNKESNNHLIFSDLLEVNKIYDIDRFRDDDLIGKDIKSIKIIGYVKNIVNTNYRMYLIKCKCGNYQIMSYKTIGRIKRTDKPHFGCSSCNALEQLKFNDRYRASVSPKYNNGIVKGIKL